MYRKTHVCCRISPAVCIFSKYSCPRHRHGTCCPFHRNRGRSGVWEAFQSPCWLPEEQIEERPSGSRPGARKRIFLVLFILLAESASPVGWRFCIQLSGVNGQIRTIITNTDSFALSGMEKDHQLGLPALHVWMIVICSAPRRAHPAAAKYLSEEGHHDIVPSVIDATCSGVKQLFSRGSLISGRLPP